MLVIRAGTHKILVRIANREDSDQKKQSDLGLHCLSDTVPHECHETFYQSYVPYLRKSITLVMALFKKKYHPSYGPYIRKSTTLVMALI